MNRDCKIHRIIAGLLFIISLFVYLRTIAPTTSFWDCGEFITCSFILGIPHPPGAPFYLLLGRIFSLIPFAADVGLRVNLISAITSALTVMLTYLIIARLIILWRGQSKSLEDRIILYVSSALGALAFAFSDSFWFNAVEAEVYAISMFFTAIIVWLILVWHEKADDPNSDRFILLIAYCVGLAIGIHLLNILALPAIFLIYYFRKYDFGWKSFSVLIVISGLIFFGIYPVTVKWLPNLMLILKKNFGVGLTAAVFILLGVTLFAAIIVAVQKRVRYVFLIGMSFLLILIGSSTYTEIYLRSQLDPVIDENDPETLENLVSYINREQYGDWSIIERRAPLWEYQLKKMYFRYLGWQFVGKGEAKGPDGFLIDTLNVRGLWGIPFLIGIMGLVHHFYKDKKRALAILLLFFITGAAIVLYLNQTDPQPRERDYVFVASFFAFAIWIGVGIAGILESIAESIRNNSPIRKIAMGAVSLLLVALIPVKMLAFNFHEHDRSGNYVAYDYSYNLLQSCEPNAILFTNGDNDTFPLWFLQYVHNIRRDVRIVNLSLLNTHWYIKQLRDEEPRVPINYTDARIEQLRATYWPEKQVVKIKVPREIQLQELADLEQRKEFVDKIAESSPELSFELGPTYMNQAIRVQDIMVLNIIATNQFRKPIYFAITVPSENMLNLDDYLRMDGLAFKLVTYPTETISPSRIKDNFFNKFSFRNLNNPDVYYNDNIQGLIVNYRTGFLRLAEFYRQEKMYDNMLETLDTMKTLIPEDVIQNDRRMSLMVGNMYKEGGRPEEFKRILEFWLNRPNIYPEEKFEYARIYQIYLNDSNRSEEICLELIAEKPDFINGYYWLFNLYNENKDYKKGIELANKLLIIHPDDQQAIKVKAEFTKLLDRGQDSTKISG